MPTKTDQKIHGCLIGAYTCERCNSPSAAAIEDRGELQPVCSKHASAAERQGLRVIRSLPLIDKA